MKKTLAIILTVLVAFSMLSVAAAATGEAPAQRTVKITFVYQTPGENENATVGGSETIGEVTIASDLLVPSGAVPEIADKFTGVSAADGKKYEYTFKGWRSSADNELYYAGTMKIPANAPAEVTMTAEYSMKDVSERQSFWNLVESIFERINLIFEYFARVFNW